MALTILESSSAPPRSAVIFDMPHVTARAARVWAGDATEENTGAGVTVAPSAAALAQRLRLAPSLRERVSLVGGDMFDATTYPGAAHASTATASSPQRKALLLRDILHDWPDEDCVRILRAAAAALKEGDSVVVVGRALDAAAADGFVRSLGSNDADIVMLGAFGSTAGERSSEHYSRLFQQAGLRLVSVTPTRSQYAILRAVAQK